MGAEFFKVEMVAKTEEEVNWAYEKVMNTLLDEKADDEASYLLDLLTTGEVEVGDNEDYKNALDFYQKGDEDEAVEVLKSHLIESQSDSLFAYTGTFLSSEYGVDFLEREFDSVEEAVAYIEENHEKWEMPMGAKVKGVDKWVVAGWCSS